MESRKKPASAVGRLARGPEVQGLVDGVQKVVGDGALSEPVDPKKALSGKTPKRQAKTTAAIPVWGPVQKIMAADCRKHPANREHSKKNVAARKASLEQIGQLEPVKVRRYSNTEYLVLGGWGRVLAARAAHWTQIECRVLLGMERDGQTVPPTEADLLGLLAEDNSQRTDLTVIERAELGRALEDAGWSTTEAARRVGFDSTGGLSNAKRLLALPEDFRTRVLLPREDPSWISQAVARRIADYAHVPEILQEIRKDLQCNRDDWLSNPEASADYCVNQAVRPVTKEAGEAMLWGRIVPAQAGQLPVVTIPVVVDGETADIPVTTAVQDWDDLSKASQRGGAKSVDDDADEPRREPKPELTAEGKRQQAREKAEQLQRRRERWEYDWRHRFVCRVLAGDPDLGGVAHSAAMRFVLWAISTSHSDAKQKLAQEIEAAGHQRGLAREYNSPDYCLGFVPAKSPSLATILHSLVPAMLADTATGNPDFPHVPKPLVWQLCGDLDFDPGAEWRRLYEDDAGRDLLRSLWSAHESAQLEKIVQQAGNAAPVSAKKTDLVDALMECELDLPEWLQEKAAKKRGRK